MMLVVCRPRMVLSLVLSNSSGVPVVDEGLSDVHSLLVLGHHI